jgi:hypothetical protein
MRQGVRRLLGHFRRGLGRGASLVAVALDRLARDLLRRVGPELVVGLARSRRVGRHPPLDGAKVIEFIRKKGRSARLAGPEKLRVEAKMPTWQERAQQVKDILQQLAA